MYESMSSSEEDWGNNDYFSDEDIEEDELGEEGDGESKGESRGAGAEENQNLNLSVNEEAEKNGMME